MPRTCARRLRLICSGFAFAGAVLASGIALRVPTLGPQPQDQRITIGVAIAQMQLLEQGLKRATEGIGRNDAVLLDNIALDLGYATYRIARVEFSESNLSRAELMALFEGRPGEPIGARLARLSAQEMRIPELRVEQDVGGAKQVAVYRDVVGRDIVNGRIASLTSADATIETTGADMGKGATGRLTITNLDLAYAAALFGEKADAAPAATKTVYGSFAVDDLRITDAKGVEFRVSHMAGKDFRARPTAQSWAETTRLLGRPKDWEKASPAERSRQFGVLADLYDAYEIGSVEATGIEIREPNAKDRANGRIARLAFTGGTSAQPADMRMEGLEIAFAKARVRIGGIAFTGFSFKDSLQGLKDLGEKPFDSVDAADLRRLVPTIGSMRFSGLDFDVPDEKSTGANAENIRFAIKGIEVTSDQLINGIPTNFRIAVENATFAVPATAEEERLRDLAAMGYGKLDLSFTTALSWSESASELALREVSVRGADMGSAMVRGVFANVSKDVFNPDSAVAMVALIGATARNLDMTIENNGLFERVIAQEAKKQKRSPEDLRREYGMAAAIAVPGMLGNSQQSKAVGQAVARFIAKPGRLNISLRAKDPGGLGIADLAAIAQPAALLEKLEVTATAQ
jgi:hypothetical protein